MRIWKWRSALVVWIFAGIWIYSFLAISPLITAWTESYREQQAADNAEKEAQFEALQLEHYKALGLPR